MIRIYLLFSLMVAFTPAARAQANELKNPAGAEDMLYHQAGELRLKFMPLGLLDPVDPSINLGLGYIYKQRRGLELHSGLIVRPTDWYSETNSINGFGFFVRPMHRWYTGRQAGGYLELGGGFKHVRNGQANQWVWGGVVNGVPAFERLMTVHHIRNVFLAEIRYGAALPLAIRSKWSFEFWAGGGLRYRTKHTNIPEGYELPVTLTWEGFINRQGRAKLFLPHVNFGFAISMLTNGKGG